MIFNVTCLKRILNWTFPKKKMSANEFSIFLNNFCETLYSIFKSYYYELK